MQAFHGNVSFSAVCEIYNSVHYSAISKDIERFSLYTKRVTRGFFTYALLDISRRYNMTIKFDQEDIDITISKNFDHLHTLVQDVWGQHRCEVKGCGEVLVIDGGLKPIRKVCAARTAAIYEFKHSEIKSVIGCKTIPTPGEQFCAEHLHMEVPNIPFQKMSKENVRTLRRTRQQVKTEKVEEDVFTIEAILQKKNSKDGPLYLVQWMGYEEKTWEPQKNIPSFILKYFEKNGSSAIPKPRIKSTKKVGTGLYYLLTWDKTSEPDMYVPESDFIISPTEEERTASCNTLKSHGAKFCKKIPRVV